MNTCVYEIEKDNINRDRYLNVMNSWDHTSNYKFSRDNVIYAISFDGKVEAGATINFKDDIFKITILNNSINHEETIKKEAIRELSDKLDQEYGVKDKIIQYIKTR